MKNQTKQKIDDLYKKIAPLQTKINDLEYEEILKVQRPRLKKLVGYCLRSTYEPKKSYYGKILDLVEDKEKSPHFILEICSITKQGNLYMHLNNVSPYLNKEWWEEEVPMSGWERCSESEYQLFKARVAEELETQKLLREFIKRKKY